MAELNYSLSTLRSLRFTDRDLILKSFPRLATDIRSYSHLVARRTEQSMFFLKPGWVRRRWKALNTFTEGRWRRSATTSDKHCSHQPSPQPLRQRIQALLCEIKEMIILNIHDPFSLSSALQVPELSSFTHPSRHLTGHVWDMWVVTTYSFSCPYHEGCYDKDWQVLRRGLRVVERYYKNDSKMDKHLSRLPPACPYRIQAISCLESTWKLWSDMRKGDSGGNGKQVVI